MWLPHEIWRDRKLDGLPSAVAGDAALRVFCAPVISERRPDNQQELVDRARYHLRNAKRQRVATPVGEMQTYTFEPDTPTARASILVIHGWTSESSFMAAVAEPIRRAGFRVILMDLPAHGLSEGRLTNLMDCARATSVVGHTLGPIHGVVTHSFGGLIALVAAEGLAPVPVRLDVKQAVLIASPNKLSDFTRDFCAHWQVSAAGRRAFEKRLERIGHRPIGGFEAGKLLKAAGCGGYVIHARDDADVTFRCAEEIAEMVPGVELQAFDGLGHRNILFASQVTRAVAAYLARTHGG